MWPIAKMIIKRSPSIKLVTVKNSLYIHKTRYITIKLDSYRKHS